MLILVRLVLIVRTLSKTAVLNVIILSTVLLLELLRLTGLVLTLLRLVLLRLRALELVGLTLPLDLVTLLVRSVLHRVLLILSRRRALILLSVLTLRALALRTLLLGRSAGCARPGGGRCTRARCGACDSTSGGTRTKTRA